MGTIREQGARTMEIQGMQRVRDLTNQRNRDMVEEYYESGMSLSCLSKKFGVGVDSVKKIIKNDKMTNGPRDRKPSTVPTIKLEDRKAVHFIHSAIGHLVSRFMIDNHISPTAFGMLGKISRSRHEIKAIEMGVFEDLTLLDVMHISEVIGIPYQDLVTPKGATIEQYSH